MKHFPCIVLKLLVLFYLIPLFFTLEQIEPKFFQSLHLLTQLKKIKLCHSP